MTNPIIRFSSGNGKKPPTVDQGVVEINRQHDLFAKAYLISQQIFSQTQIEPQSNVNKMYDSVIKEQDLKIQLDLENSIQAVKSSFVFRSESANHDSPSEKPKTPKPR